jgi:hypothetical protein
MTSTIAAPLLTFDGRLLAVYPCTFLRIRLEAAHATPRPGEYVGRIRNRAGWRPCTISVLADDATLLWCRPRPAAPGDIAGDAVKVQLTHAVTPRQD